MPHFKAFGMIDLQHEIRIWKKTNMTNDQKLKQALLKLKNLNKVTKTSQDNNLLKHFNEYLTEK